EKITVYPTRMGSYTLSVDNKTYTNRNVKKVEFSIDQRKISFVASASHTSFWERVRDSFIGDMEE
ncbi:MAG: NAD(+) kinase, partial [Streptococcus salivarius]|nr:NAD(+) kinase [Streptococcus salivarius]